MNVLIYLLVPTLVVAVWACISWARNRQPTSLQSGVDSFRREMEALSPEADPLQRRRTDGPGSGPAAARPRPGAGPSRPPRPTEDDA